MLEKCALRVEHCCIEVHLFGIYFIVWRCELG
jgi:hypothetical protein